MKTAEVLTHPGRIATPTYVPLRRSFPLTVNQPPPLAEDIDPERRLYTAAEVLEIAIEGYRRGLTDGRAEASRDRWRNLVVVDSFRAARIRTEVHAMKERSGRLHTSYGYPAGYEYRGGFVDWETGLPEGSGCAWLRAQHAKTAYGLVGGSR